jgi:hypothetical protein
MRPDASENSQINPSTIARAARAAGSQPHLASGFQGRCKIATLHAGFGVIRGMSVETVIPRGGLVVGGIRSWVNVSVFITLFALSILTAYAIGFHHRISAAEWGRSLFHIASAITAKVYNVPGNVYFEPVADALKDAGITAEVEKLRKRRLSFPANLANSQIINRAIKYASNLPLQAPPPERQNERYNIRGLGGDDPGYADLVQLSFAILSPKIESVYAGYLGLLTTSLILFLIGFKAESPYFSTVLVFAILYYFFLSSPLFQIVLDTDPTLTWGTPMSPHFMTTIAILPLLHVFAVLSGGLKFDPIQALCVSGQATVAACIIHIRFSAIWIFIALVFALFFTKYPFQKASCERRLRSTQICDWAARSWFQSWAAIVFVCVAALVYTYFQSQLHPVYNTGVSVSRHAFWTEVFYALQEHPDWLQEYGDKYKLNGQVALRDDLPIAAVVNYLASNPPQNEERSEIYDELGGLRWRAVNKYAFYAFVDFMKRDPFFVLESFYYKLLRIDQVLRYTTVQIFGGRSGFEYTLLSAVLIFISWSLSRCRRSEWSNYKRFLGFTFLAVPISLLPNLATLVRWDLMADPVLLSHWAILLGVTYAAAMLIMGCRPAFRRH